MVVSSIFWTLMVTGLINFLLFFLIILKKEGVYNVLENDDLKILVSFVPVYTCTYIIVL